MIALSTLGEIVATISGITCVYLQTKEKIIAWPFGILSVSILAVIFYHSQLYSDLLLHIVFFFLNIYGWWQWTKHQSSDRSSTPIRKLSLRHFAYWMILTFIGAYALGTFMQHQFGASMAYYDAFTTTGSLVAQYLLAKKFKDNWTFWIIVDIVAVIVYISKGIYITAFLFFVFLILSIIGYRDWSKEMKLDRTN